MGLTTPYQFFNSIVILGKLPVGKGIILIKLTILHDGQFWVGVLEWEHKGRFKAARYLFGTEPREAEILEFVKHRMMQVAERVSGSIPIEQRVERKVNPKRIIREAQKELQSRSMTSKAQQALKEDLDLRKKEVVIESKERKEEKIAYKREIARQKAKEKHKGR
jgi:hypothetical protein